MKDLYLQQKYALYLALMYVVISGMYVNIQIIHSLFIYIANAIVITCLKRKALLFYFCITFSLFFLCCDMLGQNGYIWDILSFLVGF